MYNLQDFMNTLSNAGTLIYITTNGEEIFKGEQIEFSFLEENNKYFGYKVWRIDIFEDKYLWVDINK